MTLEKKKVVIFTNVIFEEYFNRSIQNFIEGLLHNNCKIIYITTHPDESDYMRKAVAKYDGLKVIYINKRLSDSNKSVRTRDNIFRKLKKFIKQIFKYKRYQSNSEVLEWLGLMNTYKVIKKIGNFVKANDALLGNCDKYIFIDKFGGLLAQYLRITNKYFWRRISNRTAGYYLGTVLKQFGNNRICAFLVMPINFMGSYKVPLNRLIITDDGTDGEKIFREGMRYQNKILFIRNGADQKLLNFKTKEKIFNSKRINFVTCSRLTRWKRIDRAILFVNFVKKTTDYDIRLTIIGEGEERTALEQLVNDLSIQNIITFTGGLTYDKALETIALHDYYIVFNDLSGLGNQIYESIILGVIPITIDDGSTDSLLKNDYNSFKFPKCPNFEQNAATLFISKHSQSHQEKLMGNLDKTKELLFSWQERSKVQYDFIFDKQDR